MEQPDSDRQNEHSFQKGRGAQINPSNPYSKFSLGNNPYGDEPENGIVKTEFFTEFPKKIVNTIDSPDIGMPYSMNPYQGCEHGCIYCYARNTHTYWGFSAGTDFESKIIYKPEAAQLLRETFDSPKWKPAPIMLAGNTDCYQPVERELKITRSLISVCNEYKNPLGIITKNSLVKRDSDLLFSMAKDNLVHVTISITTLDEDLRRNMEPRASSYLRRLETIRRLTEEKIPVSVLIGPIIPGLTSHEVHEIIKASADAGALSIGYTMVRLNGQIGDIFTDWIRKVYPDRADKVLNQIAEAHGGKLSDSRYGVRMKGEGKLAEALKALFHSSRKKFFEGREVPDFDLTKFRRPPKHGQVELF